MITVSAHTPLCESQHGSSKINNKQSSFRHLEGSKRDSSQCRRDLSLKYPPYCNKQGACQQTKTEKYL